MRPAGRAHEGANIHVDGSAGALAGPPLQLPRLELDLLSKCNRAWRQVEVEYLVLSFGVKELNLDLRAVEGDFGHRRGKPRAACDGHASVRFRFAEGCAPACVRIPELSDLPVKIECGCFERDREHGLRIRSALLLGLQLKRDHLRLGLRARRNARRLGGRRRRRRGQVRLAMRVAPNCGQRCSEGADERGPAMARETHVVCIQCGVVSG